MPGHAHLLHGDVPARDDLAHGLPVPRHVDELGVPVRGRAVRRGEDDTNLERGGELVALAGHESRSVSERERRPAGLGI